MKKGDRVLVINDTVGHCQPIGSIIVLGDQWINQAWEIKGDFHVIKESNFIPLTLESYLEEALKIK